MPKKIESFNDMMLDCDKKIGSLNGNLEDTTKLLISMKKLIDKEKSDVEKMLEMAKKFDVPDSEIVKLNVGGSHFSTMKSTLTKKIKKIDSDDYHEPHLLQLLVSGIAKVTLDENKEIFIDRNQQFFGYILDYLRSVGSSQPVKLPKLSSDALEEFYEEAEYYNLSGLLEIKDQQLRVPSTILTKEKFDELIKLCQFQKQQKWKLIYRASQDGFASSQFHQKCDNISNTLTIIKSSNGYIFGGYTNVAWDQSGTYKNDPNSFLFSLVNPTNNPAKLTCVNASHSIYCNYGYGPTFGGNHDLHICSNSNSSQESYSNINGSYYKLPSGYSAYLLVGAYNFTVADIEVFKRE